MAKNPSSHFRVAQIERCKPWIQSIISKSHLQAPSTAEPAFLFWPNQRAAFDIAATTVDDISRANSVPTQAMGISFSDSADSVLNYPPFADVNGHNGRNSHGNVI